MTATDRGRPGASDGPIYGPETWLTEGGGEWSHWDLWFCAVCCADFEGDLEALAAELAARGRGFGSLDFEAKLSHLDELAARLDRHGLSPRALAGEALGEKGIKPQARRKVLKQGVSERDKTPAMIETPHKRLRERALRGHWDRFPASPGGPYRALAGLALQRDYVPEDATFALSDRLDERIDREEENCGGDPARRLALWRAALAVGLESMECCDDSFGVIGDGVSAAFATYFRLPWRESGIAPADYYQDLCELLVWEDYGLLHRNETEPFRRVRVAELELVERILRDLGHEHRLGRLDYQAAAAEQMVAYLNVAKHRIERFPTLARELGSRHPRPIVAMADAALARERHDVAIEVYAAANRSGPHSARLQQRGAELAARTGLDRRS